MNQTIGCLHAHYSNIRYIEEGLQSSGVRWVHYVDPGLIARLASDPGFSEEQARARVAEQMEWMAAAGLDAILLTCTQYTALLEEKRLQTRIPILKIDEPFFDAVLAIEGPQTLLFTNPGTVDGTMTRLKRHAAARGMALTDVETRVIEHAFPLLMEGKETEYNRLITEYIGNLPSEGRAVSAAQLSMSGAADAASAETGRTIFHPLGTLADYLEERGSSVS